MVAGVAGSAATVGGAVVAAAAGADAASLVAAVVLVDEGVTVDAARVEGATVEPPASVLAGLVASVFNAICEVVAVVEPAVEADRASSSPSPHAVSMINGATKTAA